MSAPEPENEWPVWIVAALVIAALLVLLVGKVHAHDHNHPELDDWYMSLHAKGGAWCCSGEDADRPDDWRTAGNHYQVFADGRWVDVPDDAIVNGMNKAGHALVWLRHTDGSVRCFMPGTMT